MRRSLVLRRLTLSSKWRRAIWYFFYIIFFRFSPLFFYGWRNSLLRLFGAKVGVRVHVYPSAKVWAPWNLVMGDSSCLGPYVDCYTVDKVYIGAGATVSQYSFLCTASHDYTQASMPLATASITIGANAWIAADVFVGPGVSIGEGTVVAARSSVFKDLPAWVVAIGSPALPIKPRLINGKKP